jgi:hypothetical protein
MREDKRRRENRNSAVSLAAATALAQPLIEQNKEKTMHAPASASSIPAPGTRDARVTAGRFDLRGCVARMARVEIEREKSKINLKLIGKS